MRLFNRLKKRHPSSDTERNASTPAGVETVRGAEPPYGLLIFDEDNPSGSYSLDIVAVHGLDGHWEKTWTDDNGKLWLRDFLPEQLRKANLNSRVMVYGYNSKTAFSRAVTNITDEAYMLLDRLQGERLTREEQGRPIIFVSHSLGGIIVKKAMILAHERSNTYGPLLRRVRGLMFFGTPHRGADAAYWANFAASLLEVMQLGRGTNTSFVAGLQRNSTEFANISDQFIERAVTVKIRTFYETERYYGELVVDRDSASLKIQNEITVGIAGANHRTICKFSDMKSQKYKVVWNAMKELTEFALKEPVVSSLNASELMSNPVIATISNDSVTDELSGLEYSNKISLPDGVIRAASNPPESIDQLCDEPGIEESLEWFIESPEYQTWKDKKHCRFLWLHGTPGDGKTVVMSYVLRSLRQPCRYTDNWDVASVFCSRDDSDIGIAASLAFQLIQKNKLRAQVAQREFPIPKFQQCKLAEESTRLLWELLETLIMAVPRYETVIIIDGIDALSTSIRSSFLNNFLTLEERVQRNTTIRVLISSRTYPDIKGALAHYPSIDREKERNGCLDTLFFQEWNARESRVERVTEGGRWLSSNHEYKDWSKKASSTVLWIEGKPGSGKSTLAKLIVNKLLAEREDSTLRQSHNHIPKKQEIWTFNSPKDQSTIIAEFYYSFRGGNTETSHELMLRSIVYQIWKQNSRLFPLLRDQYRELKRGLDGMAEQKSFWRYNNLKSALESLHRIDFDLNVIIVVDGMDESDNDRRVDVLNFLPSLSTQNSRCIIKVLIASRPEKDINRHLMQAHHIRLQDENEQDIRMIVDKGIEMLECLRATSLSSTKKDIQTAAIRGNKNVLAPQQNRDQETFSAIKKYIAENSSGVFLWVTLVLRDLERCVARGGYSRADLDDRVRSLPKDLGGRDGFYRAMVNSLISGYKEDGDQEEERGRRILAWVTFPKRPLSVFELGDALATPPQSESIDLSRYDLEQHRPCDLEQGILSACGGLVEARETSSGGIVQLIHQTAREFLLDKLRFAEPYDLDEVQGDKEIAITCCRYIRITFMGAIPQMEADVYFSQVETLTVYLSDHSLLEYALANFTTHLDHLESNSVEIRTEFENFVTDLAKRSTSYASLLLWQWVKTLNWPTNLHVGVNETSAKLCLDSVLTYAADARIYQVVDVLLALRVYVLHLAAEYGRGEVVKLLLEKGAELESKDKYGRTPLLWAARNGHMHVVQLLLDNGAELEPKDKYGRTPVLWAAENGHMEMVKLLLDRGVEAEPKDKYGRTPVLWAAGNGHMEMVKLLLDRGVEMEPKDKYGRTPVLWAAENGHMEVVKLLLENGAELESKDKYGRTPLSWATENGHMEMVKLLLENGAELEPKDKYGQTPLWAVENGQEEVVKLLLEKGAELESKDNTLYGQTPLLWAARNGHEAVVKLLLEKGAELESKDNTLYGQTPLLYAARNGHEAVVKLLLGNGAKLEPKDRYDDGWTPLLWAARNGHEAVVKLLLEKGAELESKDRYDDGWTPLWMAAEGGHEAVVKLLLEKGAKLESKDKYGQMLLWAAENGREAVVKLLLEKGADVESKDRYDLGWTPLWMAAEGGHEAVVKLLLEKGADVEFKDGNGQTPLWRAAEGGHEAVVKLLLEKGADVESKDRYDLGWTPLWMAAEGGHEAVVKLLLEKGADMESKDGNGQTPLWRAAEGGHEAVVKLLLEKGADVESKGGNGQMPLWRAAEGGHEAVVKLLLKKAEKLLC